MPSVTLNINGREHQISCGDGEERRVMELGLYLDAKVTDLSAQVGPVGEHRLMVMAALLIADELQETKAELEAARQAPRPAGQATPAPEVDAAPVEGAAARLEEIAAQLEDARVPWVRVHS